MGPPQSSPESPAPPPLPSGRRCHARDFVSHPRRPRLRRSWALSPVDVILGTAANPSGLARQWAVLIALSTVDLVCIYAN